MGSGSIKVSTTIAVQATSDAGVILNCIISCNPTKTIVTFTFDSGVPVQNLDVSLAGESVTYSLILSGNTISGTFVQSAPAGTLSFSITANGSTAVLGNF